MFGLYKNDKLLALFQFWEDAESFVEELKALNPNIIDRKNFTVRINNDIIKSWNRK